MPAQNEQIAVIGGGLTGPLLAIGLHKRGFAPVLYERRPDLRSTGASEGKSINLALSVRGIHALQQAGLWDAMRPIIVPMRGRRIHPVSGALTFQPYGRSDHEVINSISRIDLNIALLNAVEACGVPIHFEQRCIHFDPKTGSAILRDEPTGQETFVCPATVLASDGAGSAIRSELIKLSRYNISQQYLDYGYKELNIPPNAAGAYAMEPDELHIWPRGAYMLIALPNADRSFSSILFLPYEGATSFASLSSPAEARAFFNQTFPDASAFMPALEQEFAVRPVGSMVTVKCQPWRIEGKALLIGDAAHAIVPFFGQGLNCAFEDCTVFFEILDRVGPDWRSVFQQFEERRKRDADAIADMALENFIEMRDRVADPRFLFSKKVELALEARFPHRFVPRYSMVTFHRIPYSVAQSRGAAQDRILAELCAGIDRVEDLDWTKAAKLIQNQLTPFSEAIT